MHLQHLLEQISDGVLLIDHQGLILEANRAALELLGREPASVTHAPLADVLRTDDGHAIDLREIPRHAYIHTTCDTGFMVELDTVALGDGRTQICLRNASSLSQLAERLRECETLYWMTFERAGTAIAIVEPDCTISHSNACFRALSGYNAEEIHGRMKWTEMVDPHDLERMRRYHANRRRGATGVPTQYEFRFLRESGERRDVFLNVNLIPGTEQSIASMIDITEHKRAQRALEETEARYRFITGCINDYVYTVRLEDGQAVETVHGPASEAVTGYAPHELEANPDLWLTMVVPEDRAAVTAHATAIVRGEDVAPIEYRIVRKDGSVRWVRNTPIRHHGDCCQLNSYDALVRDITEQKQAELARRSSEEKHRAVIENASEGICVAQAGLLKFANPALARMVGVDAEDLLEASFLEWIHPDDRRLVAERHQRRQRGEDPDCVYAFRLQSRDGRPRWVEIRVVRIEWEGQPATLNFLTDIEERRKAEEAMVRAKNRAEAADRAKSEFLANMSHEIRTPLNGVIAMTEMLLETDLDHQQQEFARIVQSSGEVLLTVINDILDLSKIQAGKIELEKIHFDPRGCVAEIVGMLKPRAAAKGLALREEVEAGVPRAIVGDPSRLRQVLLNLAGNAVKFTEAGSIVLRVKRRSDGNGLRIEVEDTGIGISAEQRARLFLPFSQLDASTTRKYGGTGLGLAISKRLVELMGGEIEVASEPGRGSCFSFTLPGVAAAGQTAAARELSGAEPEDDGPDASADRWRPAA